MSSIITGILSSTVGFLCGKARDSAANKLKDGDVTNEKLREIIVQDLTDIKSKLDCLSLKDLDSSYSFLKDGVRLLTIALDTSNEDQKASEGPADEATRVMNDTTSGILNAALSLPQAIQRLKISSEERFVAAKDCFKASRETATHAFNNKSLGIKDRIMACKLRVAARILELGLDDPMAATTSCLLSLEELHGLPAIQEMFSVFLKGGLKSKLKKTERLENIMSVLFINHALFDFVSKYSSKYPNVFTWPGIELKDRQFNPTLHAHETLTSSSVESVQQLNRVAIETRIATSRFYFAVNSRGEIILLDDAKFTVINPSTGEGKDVMLPDYVDGLNFVLQSKNCRKAITVDSNDNVYVVVMRTTVTGDENNTRTMLYDLLLYVFDANYNMTHNCVLDFLDAGRCPFVNIAVDKDKNIFMINDYDNQVYVLDNKGQLKFKFERDGIELRSLSISDKNDIIIPSDDRSVVHIYTTEGNLKFTIMAPKDNEVFSVEYHHGICKIIVITREKRKFWTLLCYSEAGELENSVYFHSGPGVRWLDKTMASHPSGPVAVLLKESIILI